MPNPPPARSARFAAPVPTVEPVARGGVPPRGRDQAWAAASRILGLAYHLPAKQVGSDALEEAFDLEERFGVRRGTLARTTGVKTRHLADADAVPSDLAFAAAEKALAAAGVAARDLDVIIYAAVYRDFAEPSTAHIIQRRLGASGAFVFDVSNACLSMMNGVLMVDALIASGRCRTGLVCGGELASEVLRSTYDALRGIDRSGLTELFPALTCGDAGAAVVLGPRAGAPGRGFVAFEFLSRGEHADLCVLPALKGEPMRTDGPALLEAGARLGREALDRLLEKSGWTRDDVDLVIPHQISVPATKAIFAGLSIGLDRCHLVIDRFGNTAATTVPVALAHAAETGRLRPGMKVVLAGLGSGVSAGFASLVW
jgi:acyl-CoA:acyl-CoA alkyltransferase